MMMRYLWVAAMLAVLTWTSGLARGADAVFVERFEKAQPGPQWTLETNPKTQGLWWGKDPEERGWHYRARTVAAFIEGGDQAVAAWPLGNKPFEFQCDVTILQGLHQTFFEPGVFVVLSSALPGQAKEDDVALVAHVNYAGVAVAVWRGGYNWLHRGAERISQTAGGPDDLESVTWNEPALKDARLHLRITRDPNHQVVFQLLRDGLPGVWCKREATIPAKHNKKYDLTKTELKYVIVERAPVKPAHQGYEGFLHRGVVNNMQGRLADGPEFPLLQAYQAPASAGGIAVGQRVMLTGDRFEPGAKVLVGEREAAVTWVSPRELQVTMPPGDSGKTYPLTVLNASGLFAGLTGGITYGQLLQRIEPREALPKGGDIVTLIGAGLDKNTIVEFGGQRGEVVAVLDGAKVKVKVPPGKPGLVQVTARNGDQPFPSSLPFGYAPHPYMAVQGEAGVVELRKKFNEPMFADYKTVLIRNAQNALALDLAAKSDTYNVDTSAIDSLVWAYTLTGEKPYKDKLMLLLDRVCRNPSAEDFQQMMFTSMAEAYDSLFPELTPDERTKLQDYLDFAVHAYTRSRGSWFYNNPSNTVAVSHTGGGMVSLALINSSDLARQGVDAAAQAINGYLSTVLSPDGGCIEGTLYWDYGLTYALIFGHCTRNATGSDKGVLSHPYLRNNAHFPQVLLGGNGVMMPFDDTQPFLTGMSICALLDAEFDRPTARWLADKEAHEAAANGLVVNERSQFFPYGFLWRTRQPAAPELTTLPTLDLLETMQWGVLRTDGAFIPAAVVGVKGCEGALSHHKQADLGSFVYYAHGEAYLIDPGYFQPEQDAHTLPLVDGVGPWMGQGSKITSHGEKGNLRWMVVDSTAGYNVAKKGAGPARVRRTLVLAGQQVVVLDDLVARTGQPGKVLAQYQAGWKTEAAADGRSAIITGKKGTVLLEVFGPDLKLQTKGPRDFAKSWLYATLAKDGKVAWYPVTGEYQADPANPLVTVLTPTTPEQAPEKATVERSAGKVTVTLSGGTKVTFTQKLDGWTMEEIR